MQELAAFAASAGIAVALLGLCGFVGRAHARSRNSPALQLVEQLGVPPGQPAVIYLRREGRPPGSNDTSSVTRPGNRRVITHHLRADSNQELVRQLKIASLPATIIIGRDHASTVVYQGETPVDVIAEQLA